MYYSQPGKVATRDAAVLVARARAGVRVLVLLDAFGSGPLLKTDFVQSCVRLARGSHGCGR